MNEQAGVGQQERNELLNSLSLSKIEIKQLSNKVLILQSEINELKELIGGEIKKNVILERTINELKEHENNLNKQIIQLEKEKEQSILTISETKSMLHDYKLKFQERSTYIHQLEKKIQEENAIAMRKDFEATIYNQEAIIASLEEKIQLLENDIRIMQQKHGKEVELIKVDAMNAWVKLQVKD